MSSNETGGSTTATPAGGHLPQSPQEVRARREELRVALIELEDALSRPAGDHENWVATVHAALETMMTTLRAHVQETESEGGLLPQLEEDAPWLVGRVDQLRSEHGDLLERTERLLASCRDGKVEDLREEALALLQAVSRHRHRGTDLLYDAYMVDISAAD
jgi:hypothetical protein